MAKTEGKVKTRILKVGDWSDKGFTLIETMVVVLIMAAVLAIAIPRLEHLHPEAKLKSASRRLAGIIRYAHQKAALSGKSHYLVFDLEADEYWLVREEDGGLRELRNRPAKRRRLLEGVAFEDISIKGEKRVEGLVFSEFSPRGTTSLSTIHLKNTSGEIITLLINRATGRVKSYEGYITEEAR
jgi:prepilin-type N-terminal cleavage/methylation domain-containing protein